MAFTEWNGGNVTLNTQFSVLHDNNITASANKESDIDLLCNTHAELPKVRSRIHFSGARR